jgi:hypothetical protein
MANPAVATVDFYSEQGTTFRYRLWYGWSTLPADQITDVGDITDYYDLSTLCTGAKMYIRSWDRATIIQELTTTNLGIILDAGGNGSIDLFVSDVDTDLWNEKKYRHDLELEYTNTDIVKKYRGTIFNEVTNTRDL